MPGTGIKGYTGPALYGGTYNISNGIVQSGAGASNSGVANRNGAVTTSTGTGSGIGASGIVSKVSSAVANALQSVQSNNAVSNAMDIAQLAGTDSSDYGDYIRQALEIAANNTAQSQQFAREQMDYQRESDQTAMAWSAQEAQKNRDWQERLSNSAHQREVQDLLAAGLNPILSANAGAYTGSGATGQGFSSSGAMGQVDQSGSNIVGSLVSTMMNSAVQAQVAKMYTDTERYNADLQYSASRLASEASIMNNQNSNSAQKQIATWQMANDLEKTRISGEYGLQNASITGEYGLSRQQLENTGALSRTILQETNANVRNTENNKTAKYSTDYGSFWNAGPWHRLAEDVSNFINDTYDKKDKYSEYLHNIWNKAGGIVSAAYNRFKYTHGDDSYYSGLGGG